MHKRRLARLRAIMKARGLDAVLITLPASRRYLTGFTPDDGQWGESSGAALIARAGAFLLTDFRYELTARQQAVYCRTVIYKKGLAASLKELIAELRIKRLGFEAEAMLVSWHQRIAEALDGVELLAASGLVDSLRRIKDPAEARAVAEAADLMGRVLAGFLERDLTGRSERELAREVVRAIEDAGAEGPAFDPIVASGPNAAEPHAEPGDRVVAAGEMVLFDVGARLGGYCSDLSRTVVVGGLEEADDTFRRVYAVVRRAQLKALAEIRPGMTGGRADAIAREVIAEAGHGERFGHSLGHGVGLATHEAPRLGPGSDDLLEPGMIFTVEPGIYLPGWGGVRLEETVLLTEDGCRVLGGLDGFYDLE